MENNTKGLTGKLLEVQQELKAPKGQFNSFGKYKYRSCEDILESVKPLCIKRGLLLTLTDEVVLVGTWVYVKALVRIESGMTSITVTAYAREAEIKKGMDAAQITGAASSYARKYALNGLFLIDDTKDVDTQDNSKQEAPEAEQQNSQAKGVIANIESTKSLDALEVLKEALKKEKTTKFYKDQIILAYKKKKTELEESIDVEEE